MKKIIGVGVMVAMVGFAFTYYKKHSKNFQRLPAQDMALKREAPKNEIAKPFQVVQNTANPKKPFQVIGSNQMPLLRYADVSVANCPAAQKITKGVLVEVNANRQVTHAQYLNSQTKETPPPGILKCTIQAKVKGIKDFVTILPVLAKK